MIYKFLTFLFFFTIISTECFALNLVNHKKLFSVDIDSPSFVEICNDSLWTYSAKDRSIYSFSPLTGERIQNLDLKTLSKVKGRVTTLACNDKQLFFATSTVEKNKNHSQHLFSLDLPLEHREGKIKISKLELPGSGQVFDLLCKDSECFLLQDQIYTNKSNGPWRVFKISKSKYIKRFEDPLKEKNPYHNLRDKYLLPEGGYLKISGGPAQLLLLDTIRSQIVVHQKNSTYKFGEWGVWEGKLLAPKGLTLFNKKYIAVSDTSLRLIFFFDLQGRYKTTLSLDGPKKRFNYPIDITSFKNKIYVADISADKLHGFELNGELKSQEFALVNKDDPIRENLYRNPEILKNHDERQCKSCHDGMLVDSNRIFIKSKRNHPITSEVSCKDCHDGHHRDQKGEVLDSHGLGKTDKTIPYILKTFPAKLCLNCHKEKYETKNNHFNLKMTDKANKAIQLSDKFKKIKVASCLQCHGMHGADNGKLIRNNLEKLCISCHTEAQKPSSHPFGDIRDKSGKKKKIQCITCHSPHQREKGHSFARHSGAKKDQKNKRQTKTCLGCHEDKLKLVGTNKHLTFNAKKPVEWPANEAFCINCHRPHNKKKNIKKLCISCHAKNFIQHRDLKLFNTKIRGTKRVNLSKARKAKALHCITCHEPHGATGHSKFLRPKKPIIKMCLSCHEQEMNGADFEKNIFNKFHEKMLFLQKEEKKQKWQRNNEKK